MKTFKQIKQVNHNDISFFLGIPVIDAKFLIKCKIFPLSQSKREKVSIGIKDYVDVNLIEKPIHANSKLDGKGMIETVVNTYNKGVTPHSGQAALAGVKRGQVILRVGDMDVQTKSLSRILEALRSQPRPVTVLFKKAKTVKALPAKTVTLNGSGGNPNCSS